MRLLSFNNAAVHRYRYDNCRALNTVEQGQAPRLGFDTPAKLYYQN
jgi:hypothetical protein